MKPSRSWTHRSDCDLDHKAMHDFTNMLREFQSAVERQDSQMQQWAVGELNRMYAEALKKEAK